MSKIKNLQILASTLSEQKMNEISLSASNAWMFSSMLSEYIARPNPEFIDSLRNQESKVVVEDDQPGLKLINGT